jgi:hypothetical protein
MKIPDKNITRKHLAQKISICAYDTLGNPVAYYGIFAGQCR